MNPAPNLFDMRNVHPGKILRGYLDAKGWTQEELAAITGLSRQSIHNIMAGKSNISPETAAKFAAAFGNTPEEWIRWDGLYRLAASETDVSHIPRLARLYDLAPIREMQKRGWISISADPIEIEQEIAKFFGRNPLDEEVLLPIAARRPSSTPSLSPAEKAWCFRVCQLAKLIPIPGFDPARLNATEKRLRELAAFPKESRHITRVLSECGIRFVVIEPIAGSRIDGATLWIDSQPVIALSIRHDRIDGFWFTLMHEFAHVRNGDASVDTELIDGIGGVVVTLVEDEIERRANKQASASLVPLEDMDSFIRRVGPLYPRERIIQFANKSKIHPGIVVGQLQHRKEIGYSALRPFLVKIREIVISTALTDGWNQSVPEF
jgi:HTH-type transcriptional regulator/antitoxin HigA